MAWGVLPHVLEQQVPRHTRKEMEVHWRWRNERARLLHEKDAANTRTPGVR